MEKGLFDVIVGVTLRKGEPHPDVFKSTLKKLKVKPEDAVFVGHSIDADYNGTENVRIEAILVRRTEDNTKRISRLRTIPNLEEIFKYTN